MNSGKNDKTGEERREKRIKIGSINIQKGIDNKIIEIRNTLDRLEIVYYLHKNGENGVKRKENIEIVQRDIQT